MDDEKKDYYSCLRLGGRHCGGVLPWGRGDERQKGSHAMSGYHAFELCYLAAVYTNLLVTGKPLDLYFRPLPGAFGGKLRVAPDLLPEGRVIVQSVEIDGRPWTDFDPRTFVVNLPAGDRAVKVKVRLAPAPGAEAPFRRLLGHSPGSGSGSGLR